VLAPTSKDSSTCLYLHLRGSLEHGSGGESTGSGGIQNSLKGTGTIGGDDVEGAGDGATIGHLRQSAARLGHGGSQVADSVLATSIGLTKSIGLNVGLAKDSGIELSLLVGAGAGNDGTHDSQSSAVATSVTSDDSDLAVSDNKGRGCQSQNDDLGEHIG
jgi:hypothetical protein